MGWTSYHAEHYRNGKIDRKAECDAYFMEGLNAGYFRVEKSAMIGSTYYAAVTPLISNDGKIPEADRWTYAVVFLTSTDMKEYYNFSYKDMDETMMPYCFDCPRSILALLSPTENKYALEWREKCREKRREKAEAKKSGNSLANLPVGAVIEFEDFNGTTRQYVKHSPAYQFKTPFWFDPALHQYLPRTRIPENYRIVTLQSVYSIGGKTQ